MDDEWLRPQTPATPDGSTLALLRLGGAFTQDELLTTDDFIKRAERFGVSVTLEDLEALHRARLLKPFYLVREESMTDAVIDTGSVWVSNVGNWVRTGAAQGKVADPQMEEEDDEAFPYQRPDDAPHRWWNGYVYSSWQVLDLPWARQWLHFASASGDPAPEALRDQALHRRATAVALAGLSTRHLPNLVGSFTTPPDREEEGLWRSRFVIGEDQLLELAGYPLARLRQDAERLLAQAHMADPMGDWWPLVRLASARAWESLSREPLLCLWMRIAADILLRAHEELAANGQVEPLPDLGQVGSWHPLLDRVTPKPDHPGDLDEVLSEFGLSPHPAVVILAEGKTEEIHFSRLIEHWAMHLRGQVQVLRAEGADADPKVIARYIATPQLSPSVNGIRLLTRSPTAFIVAVDQEKQYRTPLHVAKELAKLHDAVRAEALARGGSITQGELDTLLQIRTWGKQKYEFANFTDEELTEAIMAVSQSRLGTASGNVLDPESIRAALSYARDRRLDIDVALERLRAPIGKPAIAEYLVPSLLHNVDPSDGVSSVQRPVIKLMLDVQDLATRLSYGRFTVGERPDPPT